jgi:WD repeat-containing protein 23
MLPNSPADMVIQYNARCYSGQFSQDGNFFFCCDKDFNVRLYDTTNPYNWKFYKCVNDAFGQWTITDGTLSPNNSFLAYSSITPIIQLVSTNPDEPSEPTPLKLTSGREHGMGYSWDSLGVWSLRFSGDGKELVAGTNNRSIYVYDIQADKTVLRIHGHDEDVNAVCYGDKLSPHILYSGSDDATLKVWDRRSLADGRPAGVFIGHLAGLTYVDSKGDGRYVLSNGKDQTMKLWDLRKMHSASFLDQTAWHKHVNLDFDYRREIFPDDEWDQHPNDNSAVTFRGHTVLRTLIRCHFSPPGSTNSRYVYTGSTDGKVYVYNMDATLEKTIDVNAATGVARAGDEPPAYNDYGYAPNYNSPTCVRDASWHPTAPIIAGEFFNLHHRSFMK